MTLETIPYSRDCIFILLFKFVVYCICCYHAYEEIKIFIAITLSRYVCVIVCGCVMLAR